MKLSPYILLTTFLLFFTETIKLPAHCFEVKKVDACAACKAGAAKSCDNPKSGKEGGNTSSQCSDCIIFSLWFHQAVNSFSSGNIFIQKEYALTQIKMVADYSAAQWKPPDVILL